MDYWKEAEKIYTDLEHKGYRMEFSNENVDDYCSDIHFREKGTERNDYFMSLSFCFPIERLSRSTYWELEEEFCNTQIVVYDKTKAKQLLGYLVNEFKFDYLKNWNFICANRCSEPLKMFHFYVTVAEKYYSSIISKAKEIVIEEG